MPGETWKLMPPEGSGITRLLQPFRVHKPGKMPVRKATLDFSAAVRSVRP